jgi:hypothetical protein
MTNRTLAAGLALLAIFQVTLAVFVLQTGYLSGDEVSYEWQARAFSLGNGLDLTNGLPGHHSELFGVDTAKVIDVRDGMAYSKYPPLAGLLAAPLYGLLGMRSLMVVNSLAFVVLMGATASLSRHWSSNPNAAGLSLIFLMFGSPLWIYSVALWPHMLALALVFCALALSLRAAEQHSTQALMSAAGAGLCLGLAMTARLDAIFAAPAIAWPWIGQVPLRWRPAIAAATAGMLPLAGLSWANSLKFGSFNPLSYGVSMSTRGWVFIPLLFVAMCGLAARLAWELPAVRARVHAYRRTLATTTLLLFAVALLAEPVRTMTAGTLRGLWALLFDLAWVPPSVEPALVRTPNGALAYGWGVKTSLFQGAPMLAIGLANVPRGENALLRSTFMVAIACYLMGFCPTSWHGGFCFNLRYFLPLVPLLAIAAAGTLAPLLADPAGGTGLRMGAAFGFLAFFGPVITYGFIDSAHISQIVYPAGTLLGVAGFGIGGLHGRWAPTRQLLPWVAGIGLGWGGAVTFAYHAVAEQVARGGKRTMSEELATFIGEDDLVIYGQLEGVAALKELKGAQLAGPGRNKWAEVPNLVELAHEQGRDVFAVFLVNDWPDLLDAGHFKRYQLEHVETSGALEMRRLK